MTCITIASWMLVVVGAIVFIPSFYFAKYIFTDVPECNISNVVLFTVSIIFAIVGFSMFIFGIIPYIPILPCIQVIP
ncbi:MAG: hypothetical protein WCX79_01200 [Candidatus Paceibacterota bacterium]|jgi:hypothetical protein